MLFADRRTEGLTFNLTQCRDVTLCLRGSAERRRSVLRDGTLQASARAAFPCKLKGGAWSMSGTSGWGATDESDLKSRSASWYHMDGNQSGDIEAVSDSATDDVVFLAVGASLYKSEFAAALRSKQAAARQFDGTNDIRKPPATGPSCGAGSRYGAAGRRYNDPYHSFRLSGRRPLVARRDANSGPARGKFIDRSE